VAWEGTIGDPYRGTTVLVTGHTGFKGAWLSLWLEVLGAEVIGMSLEPDPDSLFTRAGLSGRWIDHFQDIRDFAAVEEVVAAYPIDLVFHLAAQPLVRTGFEEPLSTFQTNTMGTANVLEATRRSPTAKGSVVITTDKVYRPVESTYDYREDDPLGGHDPYAASKAAAEHVASSWRTLCALEGTQQVAVARAGNVIGGGDYARDRLLPDLIRAFAASEVAELRHPAYTRPWQHVLDPLAGYLMLGARVLTGFEAPHAVNFGPTREESVGTVADLASQAWGAGASWREVSVPGVPETPLLSLSSQLARDLGWQPAWNTQEAIVHTVDWWRAYFDGVNALELCLADLERFMASQVAHS
jgi:CDP-glucose 4,6-dehydratase